MCSFVYKKIFFLYSYAHLQRQTFAGLGCSIQFVSARLKVFEVPSCGKSIRNFIRSRESLLKEEIGCAG
jgi:hypothetical protein